MIRSRLLSEIARLGHAHSERADGHVGGLAVPGAALGRANLVRAAGGDPERLAVPHQVHGSAVARAATAGEVHPATDALVTTERGLPLLVQGADCPLVAVCDDAARAVAVVHSGWRGTAARISDLAVGRLAALGASRERLTAAVFPGIGPCCFEVGPDVESALRAAFGAASRAWFRAGRPPDRLLFDVRAAIAATLAESGVPRARIELVPGCTACDGRFHSHRASRGAPERHGLVAVLR